MEIFDPSRYVGLWYEIGRQNAPFEAFCASSTADYTLQNGTLYLLNTCFDVNKNIIQTIQGIAVPTGNGSFQITFETGQTGVYNVLYTDYNNYAFVGNVSTGYLSILSRRPISYLSESDIMILLREASSFGFNNVQIVN